MSPPQITLPNLIFHKIKNYHRQNLLLQQVNQALRKWKKTTPNLEFHQTYTITYQDDRLLDRKFIIKHLELSKNKIKIKLKIEEMNYMDWYLSIYPDLKYPPVVVIQAAGMAICGIKSIS